MKYSYLEDAGNIILLYCKAFEMLKPCLTEYDLGFTFSGWRKTNYVGSCTVVQLPPHLTAYFSSFASPPFFLFLDDAGCVRGSWSVAVKQRVAFLYWDVADVVVLTQRWQIAVFIVIRRRSVWPLYVNVQLLILISDISKCLLSLSWSWRCCQKLHSILQEQGI